MYGSLFNRMMDSTNAKDPEVGDGATILLWSDRHAATIIEVVNFKSGPNKGKPRLITVQEDKAIRVDNLGMSDVQDYRYERNEQGAKRTYTAKKDGTFKGLLIGHRKHYYDFSF
jgi:hypothetical protein